MFSDSTDGKRNNLSYRPSVEALESRSLLDATAFVQSLYSNLLQRTPTDAEVNGWVSDLQNGVTTTAVTAAFVGSSERIGLVISNEYSTLLGRSVDQPSLNFWMQLRANGASQDQVEAAILGSQEYFNLHSQANSSFVQGVYMDALGRMPGNADLVFWTDQLESGVSRAEASLRILGSHEGHQREVDMAYVQILHRNVDDMGSSREFWASFLDSGHTEADLIVALSNSTEYLTATGIVA